MDIFGLRDQLIEDYKSFTGSFVQPRDERIQALLARRLEDAEQSPDPWLSLNPSFATGGTPADLIAEGLLDKGCEPIFRVKKGPDDTGRDPIVFHRHQRDAIEVARTGKSYVLTTGTGSGKSLAYIVPIVDRVLREQLTAERGVKAIIVYPMNALANSQREELRKFLEFGTSPSDHRVTFDRYTGQAGPEERRRILANPPDILLTNYVMLDLVLTRPEERNQLVAAARGLRFLVLDELHTYRGRQGADVAMLVRRVRNACEAPGLQVVGTSATMASAGTLSDRRRVVADVATRLFGTPVDEDHVIGETLLRATTGGSPGVAEMDARVVEIVDGQPLPETYEAMAADPLANWVEQTFGLASDPESGEPVRGAPMRVTEAAAQLAGLTGRPEDECAVALKETLLASSQVRHPVDRRPLFAFRLHQFISKGDNVYASLESPSERHLTSHYQLSVPGDASKSLLPLGYCRECGQDYYVVARVERDGGVVYLPRSDRDASGGDMVTGYIYASEDHPWPADPVTEGRLPDHWLVDGGGGPASVAPNKRKYLPASVWLLPDGTVGTEGEGLRCWFMSTPFAFCLRCRVSYEQVRGSDFAKLATLDQEGRSSAVTVLSASVVNSLRRFSSQELAPEARKLLTFVDNRQDASLQAGHFNDFAQVAQLRAALCRALSAAPAGLTHEVVSQAVTAAMGLELADYADSPGVKFPQQRDMVDRALRAVVEYRLYTDLKRGWRVTMPNLEQVGLLVVRYVDLPEIASDADTWSDKHEAIAAAPADLRQELCKILLDEMRRVLAVDVDCLTPPGYERLQRESGQQLKEPWVIAGSDRMEEVGTAFARAGTAGAMRSDVNLSGRAAFGRYLRTSKGIGRELTTDDAQHVITDMLTALASVGLLTQVMADSLGRPGYRIKASAIRWALGDGKSAADDPIRRQLDSETLGRVNPFFRDLYRGGGLGLAGLYAREHTAQVPSELREQRERLFSEATLPLLYCSPTMELRPLPEGLRSRRAVGSRQTHGPSAASQRIAGVV
ncbi:MAG: DEAD/DEAH box helicase [Acidimicrobiales bacterium]